MSKPKFTPEEQMKLEILRKDIDRYQNILRWQKIREAEKNAATEALGIINGKKRENSTLNVSKISTNAASDINKTNTNFNISGIFFKL